MASRAHVFHDFALGRSSDRPRREVWYPSEDPVVLPKTGVMRLGGGLILAALTAGALIAGSAYSVLYAPAPAMARTEAAPLTRDYTPDRELARANVTNQLSGPARAALQTAAPGTFAEATPLFAEPRREHEVLIDDSAPGAQQGFPQPSTSPHASDGVAPLVPEPPGVMPQAPYPSPTMTPPEMVAPSEAPAPAPSSESPHPTPDPAPIAEDPYF